MKTWTIATTMPAPSMSQTMAQIQAPTYKDAVDATINSWKQTGRATSLHSGDYAVYYWHRIAADGQYKDRNGGSGVSEAGTYSR